MKNFDLKNIPLLWQTFIVIILTIIFVLGFSTIITINNVNINFDNFIVKQGETLGKGYGRELSEIYKEEKHEKIVDEFKNTVIEGTIISVVIAVIISSVLAYIFSKKITKPIIRLNESISNVAKLKNVKHLSASGTKEITDLALSYNSMIDRLISLEDMRDDLVDDVVHELRTPLARIVGDLEGVRDKIYQVDETVISRVLRNAYRLDTLINRLTHFANIRAGKIKITKKKIFVHKIIKDIISTIDIKEYPAVNIKNLVSKKLTIDADLELITEVFENLINNAIKYTNNGFINILNNSANNQLYFIDSGVGIKKENLQNIFERFYRVDKSRNVKSGGLGLGLAIVREIVEAHGWNISAMSPLKDFFDTNIEVKEIIIKENKISDINFLNNNGSAFVIDISPVSK